MLVLQWDSRTSLIGRPVITHVWRFDNGIGTFTLAFLIVLHKYNLFVLDLDDNGLVYNDLSLVYQCERSGESLFIHSHLLINRLLSILLNSLIVLFGVSSFEDQLRMFDRGIHGWIYECLVLDAYLLHLRTVHEGLSLLLRLHVLYNVEVLARIRNPCVFMDALIVFLQIDFHIEHIVTLWSLSCCFPCRSSRLTQKRLQGGFYIGILGYWPLGRGFSPCRWWLLCGCRSKKLVVVVHDWGSKLLFDLFLIDIQFFLHHHIYIFRPGWHLPSALFESRSRCVIVLGSPIVGKHSSAFIWICHFLKLLVVLCEQFQGFHHGRIQLLYWHFAGIGLLFGMRQVN